jgi:hypothetical protein
MARRKASSIRPPIDATYRERQLGTSLGVALLTGVQVVLVTGRVLEDPGLWPILVLLGVLAGFFSFLAVVTYRRKPAALTPSAWAYAFGWASLLELIWGTFTLVTGRTPGRFGGHRVPRSSSEMDFAVAGGAAIVAYALSRWRVSRQRRSQTENG